ncbi:hypothetical protein KAR91_39065 [Candidatus Pacearchaeota archaeon]|nr:hypothetical protein [Candidatus Pacearchaeota archaeon]
MKKMKTPAIIQQAKFFADNATSYCGGENAERILKLAYEKVKAKNEFLRSKYDDKQKED